MRIIKTNIFIAGINVKSQGTNTLPIEPSTVYVNPYYIATHYREQVFASKHYYMGGLRFATALISLPYRPPGYGGPGLGEPGENPPLEQDGYSQMTDGVIEDMIATIACLTGLEQLEVSEESFHLQSLGEISELFECEDAPNQTLVYPEELCNCEQDLYAAQQLGFDCDLVSLLYFYHPDYLGSVEFVTDMRGDAYQFFLNTPWGENVENQFAKSYTSFSSRFRFNGKERDWETGNYYYGARYYDPEISLWLGVDELASEYSFLTPYAMVANNPLILVDPDGRKIWITGTDGTIYEYSSGMKYEGEDEFVAATVRTLNSIAGTENGGVVLGELINSDGIYNYTSRKHSSGAAAFVQESDMLGGTFWMGNAIGDAETYAHESFHAFQHEKGQGGGSIHNEVEAYMFGN